MQKILVTGGCGYIGSHTIVDLIENGYDVISIDNNSRSNPEIMQGIAAITGKSIKNYKVDLCNFEETQAVFQENTDIDGVIHFAAFKAVGESVENPLLYFDNNIVSLINIVKCCDIFSVPHFVFSSSCTVYGNPDESPVTEHTQLKKATSPYGYTKQVGEEIIEQSAAAGIFNATLLRYFNPVGAHPKGHIGELPMGKPANLVPAITQTAIGKLPQMQVFGNDYPTKDGSCVRDYIHVCDIAHAHTLALQRLSKNKQEESCEVFNLGSGNGYTVFEVIDAFEKISQTKLNFSVTERRPGDVITIFANNEKAQEKLSWHPKFNLEEMMQTAWNWEKQLHNLK